MNALTKTVGLATLLWAVAVTAHAEPKGHHVHLTAEDADADARWYIAHMGGTMKTDNPIARIDRAFFGEMALIFYQKKPGYEGSVGSVVDHIGFSFADLDAKMERIEKSGVTILQPVKVLGDMKFAFIEGPSGVKIELLEDPDQLGFHHVHLLSTTPEETIAWFAEIFGGETTHFKGSPVLPAVRYKNMWVIAQKTDEAKAPTKGRALDHLGFGLIDLDGYAEAIKAKGIEFTLVPRNYKGNRIAFLVSPEGINIELVQPGPKNVTRTRPKIQIDVGRIMNLPEIKVNAAPIIPKIDINISLPQPKPK